MQQMLAAQFTPSDPPESIAALPRWRDRRVALSEPAGCVGGCPLGRLAGKLAESDPSARPGLAAGIRCGRRRWPPGCAGCRSAS
jgi:TetR/AcrR family transcriptional repressor of nem operon